VLGGVLLQQPIINACRHSSDAASTLHCVVVQLWLNWLILLMRLYLDALQLPYFFHYIERLKIINFLTD